jgi:DTW domain-containing protein YfiP
VGVARHLDQRLQNARTNNDCPVCWLQRAHCICNDCPPVDASEKPRVARLNRLLVYHHKEICLAVDTAKLLASTLPQQIVPDGDDDQDGDDARQATSHSQVRVGVGCIPAQFQDSMVELEEALQSQSGRKCLVLFPDETARTWKEFQVEQQEPIANDDDNNETASTDKDQDYDVIVLDGTWEQARELYRRYVPDEASGGPYRIQL